MTRLSLWGYELEVDEQATRAWYAQAEEWSCTCGHCRNFLVLARERKLPEEILHILDSLSIPVEKATYVCELYHDESWEKKGLLYEISWRVAGAVVQTPEKKQNNGTAWGPPVVFPTFQMMVGHECYNIQPEFPEPSFDLDISLYLPWVLDEPLDGPEEETTLNHEIIIETEVDGAEEYADLLRQVIPATLAAEGVDVPCEVDVLFTDDEGIHQINLEQREVDRPTDVLSFPMFDLQPGEHPTQEDADPGDNRVPLGDMVISLERAKAQGEEYGHGTRREVAYLAVHSVLHLLGYDHMDEGPMKKQMRQREEEILGTLGIVRE